MITLTQAERLVRKIAEVTGQPASDTQMAKLAQDYSDLCLGANRRLEQCAIMIEAGQFLQALQLAETPPPLLDLITVLSFRQSTDWRAYCQGHQLPWTEPFNDKYVRLLTSTYNRGIAGDHPFYRDYRRAVMNNDDDRAISILRVIARLNPSDDSTKEELKRLEGKLLRGKLENLRQFLAKGDGAAVQAQLEQIETSALPIPSAHPIWQQAQVARSQHLLRRAEEFRRQDAWQDAEALIDEFHSFATQYKVQMPPADAEGWTAMESWTKAQRAAFVEDQDFQRAVSALDLEIKAIESRQATPPPPNLAEVTGISNSLDAKCAEAQRFNRPLDSSLTNRCQQSKNWLQNRMRRANRKKLAAAIAVLLLVFAAIGAAVFFIRDWLQQRELVKRFEVMEAARKVHETETLLTLIPPKWEGKSQIMECSNAARKFLAGEYKLKQTNDENMDRLKQVEADRFQIGPAQTAARRLECGDSMAKLAPDFQPANRILLSAWDEKWQAVRNAALIRLLDHSDRIIPFLQGTNDCAHVQDALGLLESDKTNMEPWMTEPPPLDTNIKARFVKLTNMITEWTGNCKEWVDAQSSLTNAQTLDGYLSNLDRLVLSPFASAAQRSAASKIDSLNIVQAALLGELLLPSDTNQWASLTNLDSWRMTLMPEKKTDQDMDVYAALRDDKNMTNVWTYTLTASTRTNNPFKSHEITVQGSMTTNLQPARYGNYEGMVYDSTEPGQPPNRVSFVPKSYDKLFYASCDRGDRAQESDDFDRLGLGNLINPSTGNYQKPILQLLDDLNHAETRTVFRAIVAWELFNLAELRPAEWGLVWCPDAARQRQALQDAGAPDLKSGDWMLPSKCAKYDESLQKFFSNACAVSLENQARFLQGLTLKTCREGFSFAGFVGTNGQPVLRQITSSDPDYWGWGVTTNSAVLLFRKTGGGAAPRRIAEPLPFTPLFIFNGDRRELVNQAAKDSGYPINKTEAILPPFFLQSTNK